MSASTRSASRQQPPPDATQRAQSIRKRSRRACLPCRRRKRKCDGKLPCRTCQEYEYTCAYEEDEQASTQVGTRVEIPEGTQVAPVEAERDTVVVDHGLARRSSKVFEPDKRRFYDENSAISFPRALALSLKAGIPPRIHSFAYNVGVVPEQFLQSASSGLSSIVTYEEAQVYTQKYFEIVNEPFGIIDQDTFTENLHSFWQSQPYSLQYETVTCFVILLGSFFQWRSPLPQTRELAHHAQELLDRSNFHDAPSLLHEEHAQAWVLRTMYLRCTTRPNITWISSSIALNVMESLGLHREPDTLEKLELNMPPVSTVQLELRRRLFWTAWAFNRLMSFEIGRSATFVSAITSELPATVSLSSNLGVVEACLLLYPRGSHTIQEHPEQCLAAISRSAESEGVQDVLVALVRSELACGLYREIYKVNSPVGESVGKHLVSIVTHGLTAARQLLAQEHPWWLLVSIPFQFICVAVAVGKSSVLELLPEAMRVLKDVKNLFNTHMTKEAYDTAQLLIKLGVRNKDKELAALHSALEDDSGFDVSTPDFGADLDWGFLFDEQAARLT